MNFENNPKFYNVNDVHRTGIADNPLVALYVPVSSVKGISFVFPYNMQSMELWKNKNLKYATEEKIKEYFFDLKVIQLEQVSIDCKDYTKDLKQSVNNLATFLKYLQKQYEIYCLLKEHNLVDDDYVQLEFPAKVSTILVEIAYARENSMKYWENGSNPLSVARDGLKNDAPRYVVFTDNKRNSAITSKIRNTIEKIEKEVCNLKVKI